MLSLFFIIFAIDKRKCVGHNERRALLKLDLLIKFSQNLNTQKVGEATTLTLWLYTILWDNYILALAWVAVAYPLCRQCEKPDKRISKIQSSRFLHINETPTGGQGNFLRT